MGLISELNRGSIEVKGQFVCRYRNRNRIHVNTHMFILVIWIYPKDTVFSRNNKTSINFVLNIKFKLNF